MKVLTFIFFTFSILATTLAQVPKEKQKSVEFIFALYFAPEPTAEPEAEIEILLGEKHKQLDQPKVIRTEWMPTVEYPPPSPETFRYAAVGLQSDMALKFADSSKVLLLTFSSEPSNCVSANQQACEFTADLAEATGGYPWDEECRLMYSTSAWRSKRVDTWHEGIPNIIQHVNMHAYRNPELVRIITLGMRKFNLPDLAMNQVNSGSSRSAGNTINYIAQALLEGQRPNEMQFTLVLDSIKHPEVRSIALENPLEGAVGRVDLLLTNEEWEEGDPYNAIFNLTFPSMEASTEPERQGLAFKKLYGSNDEVQGIKGDDPELLAASREARDAFFKLKEHFNAGLKANERLVIKHGFSVSGEKEYMWVEVLKWDKKTIQGILLNDSFYDDKLVSGKRVKIPLSEVFDYIHYRADGTSIGNETGKVISKRQ